MLTFVPGRLRNHHLRSSVSADPSSLPVPPSTTSQQSLPASSPPQEVQHSSGLLIPSQQLFSPPSSSESSICRTRNQCLVPGCPERIAPTMERTHMSLHAHGVFHGALPPSWLAEQDVFICPNCSHLVANSRAASHSQQTLYFVSGFLHTHISPSTIAEPMIAALPEPTTPNLPSL